MSYILDALRKADAERERDPARGIHAQPGLLPASGRSGRPGWTLAAGVVVGVVAVTAYVLWERGASTQPPTAGGDPARVGVPLASPAPVPVAPVAPAAAPVATAVQPPAPPPVPAAAPAPAPAPAPARAPAPAPAPAPAGVANPAQPAAPASDRILAVGELPPGVQSDLPKLKISGGVHSEDPAQRLLIVAGQVVHEGAELAPGVVLEQIRPRSAVLRFRGYRFSIVY